MEIHLPAVIEDGSVGLQRSSAAIRVPRYEELLIVLHVQYPSGVAFTPAVGDSGVLTIKKSSEQITVSAKQGLQKTTTFSKNVLSFALTSTEVGSLPAGRYVWDAWLVHSDTSRVCIVELGEFFVMPTTTRM